VVDLSKSINLSNSGCLTVGGSAAGEEDGAEDEELLERRVDDESSEVPPAVSSANAYDLYLVSIKITTLLTWFQSKLPHFYFNITNKDLRA